MLRPFMLRLYCFLATMFVTSATLADELTVGVAKDVTLYQSSSGRLANGAGTFLYSGRTGQPSNGIRRALLSFDLGELPDNALVTAAELSLSVTKTATEADVEFALHRVLTDWNEGESDASTIGQGQGITALDGETTWIHTNKPDVLWQQPGGDFAPTASDTILIDIEEEYRWGGGGELNNDLQLWLDHPETNFGWILIGDETSARTAKQFNSRTNEDAQNRPALHIQFEILTPGDCNRDGVVDVMDLDCLCSSGAFEDVLTQLNLIAGDLDGNGFVDFEDFVQLSNHFGQRAGYSHGDMDCSGVVDFDDFVILANNFGRTFVDRSANIPEPNSGVLLLIGLGLWAGTQRRRVRNTWDRTATHL